MIQRTKPGRAEGGVLSARSFFASVSAVIVVACGPVEPSLAYKDGVVVASGWSGPAPAGGWESVLSVRASADASAPAMLGEYRESGGTITFTPRFPPSPGVQVRAMFHVNQKTVEATFGEPAKAGASTTRVAHIYPSTDVWPANTLRMYVEFSAPMARGRAYEQIRVIGSDGAAIEKPFVEIEPELWDPSGRRLTLLFDPGRVKRGLVDNEASGPPLVPGRTITIEVGAGMRDAAGAALTEKLAKPIRVAEAVRAVIDPARWRIDPPREPGAELVVTFDRPLDSALAQRAISVVRDSSPVAGKIALEESEARWRFTPDSAWAAGAYQLVVNGILEDVAGNRPGKVFDVDTSDPTQSTVATPETRVPFTVVIR